MDGSHKHIYWASSGNKTISVATVDGRRRCTLFSRNLSEPGPLRRPLRGECSPPQCCAGHSVYVSVTRAISRASRGHGTQAHEQWGESPCGAQPTERLTRGPCALAAGALPGLEYSLIISQGKASQGAGDCRYS